MAANDDLYTNLSRNTVAAITNEYLRAFQDIKLQLADLYTKHENNGTLNYSDLARFNALQGLQNGIYEQLNTLTGINKRRIYAASVTSYVEGYFNQAFKLEKGIKANLQYGLMNPNTIIASVLAPIDKITLNQRLEQHRQEIQASIRTEMTQSLIKGESYGDMSKRVKNVLEGDAAKAIKVVNTETHRTMSDGRMASIREAQENGVDMLKVWVSTLDGHTRDTHKALDGQKVKPDEPFKIRGLSAQSPGNFMVAAEDINCRCSMRGEIAGYEPTERRQRDEHDGPSYIAPQTTYRQWMEGKFTDKKINRIDNLINGTVAKIIKQTTPKPTPAKAPAAAPPGWQSGTFNPDEFRAIIEGMNDEDRYKTVMAQVNRSLTDEQGIDLRQISEPTKIDLKLESRSSVKNGVIEYKTFKINPDDPNYAKIEVPKPLWKYLDRFNAATTMEEQIKVIRDMERDNGPLIDRVNKLDDNMRMESTTVSMKMMRTILNSKYEYVNLDDTLRRPGAAGQVLSATDQKRLNFEAEKAGVTFSNNQVTYKSINATESTQKSLNKATKWLQERVDPAFIQNKTLSIKATIGPADLRAWERMSEGIFIAQDEKIGVIIHETAHYLHDHNKKSQQLVNTFFEKRINGEPETAIYVLKDKKGNTVEEIGYKDTFIDHYIGKRYEWEGKQHGLEVVSMGMQYMYKNPTDFLIKDPEHFKLIYALMKGWF